MGYTYGVYNVFLVLGKHNTVLFMNYILSYYRDLKSGSCISY